MTRSHAALAVCLLPCIHVQSAMAQEAPSFERPGISFSTQVLPPGSFAWEQGLPDASLDRDNGVRTRTWVADTLLRFGLSEAVEVQIGADSFGGVDVQGNGINRHGNGGGDGWASVKWALPGSDNDFSWALLGTATLPFGEAPLGGGGHDYDVGVTAAWSLAEGREFSLYADRTWGDGGSGWLFSSAYGFALSDAVGAYVEAGYGTGASYARVAGGGITWMVSPRVQLDASLLRGLDDRSVDWQGGVGFAIFFD